MFLGDIGKQRRIIVVFVMSGLVFMKLRKLKSHHRENEKFDLYKAQVFSLSK